MTLADEFGNETVRVTRPKELCAPADKDGEAPGAEHHLAHLMCYSLGTRLTSAVGRVFINNEFGSGQQYVRRRDELCVPSVVNPP